jgi:hypothetical protein
MSGTPYSQTILFDANRLSSEEFSASNLAQTDTSVFTNRVAGGVTLDIGDQVSIQSAHIAQRGAGGEVIEMKGRNLGKKTISYTKFTNSSYVGNFLKVQGPGFQRYSPTGFAKQVAENIDEQVDMKDNEATIVVEFYKNTNGENCMTLPRNFGNVSGRNASVAHYNKAGGTALAEAKDYWEVEDGYPLGINSINYDLRRRLIFDTDVRIDDDWSYEYNIRKFDGGQNGSGRKVRQDNSRFTLFKRSSMVYNGSQVSAEDLATSLQPKHGVKPDPAVADYVRFRKKITLRIDEGYNTPSNIAAQITDQLTEPEDSKVIIESEGIQKTVIQESKLNVAFGSPSHESFNSSCSTDFFGATLSNHMPISVSSASSVQSGRSVAYSNAYDYVGFKRPDFVEAGRACFAYHGNKTTADIGVGNAAEAVIRTNITWSDEVLLKIKRFFDSQKLYPELLDGGTETDGDLRRTNYAEFNTTSASLNGSFREVGRFLHMDLGYQSQGTAKDDIEPLGDDMYNVSYSSVGANVSDKTSCPVFVYFDNNTSHLTASDTIGDTDYNLAYGFARKINDKIAFTTKLIGGIPDIYFNLPSQDVTVIKAATKIGYDYHFSAYGNAAILLHSGYNTLQYFGHQGFLGNRYIENVYVGADNPLFTFDTVENRFEFQNLHTAEKTSNFYNAGDPVAPNDILSPPPSGQSDESVYFINKQMRYDNWSPDMHPYPKINLSGTPSATGGQQSFINTPSRLQGGLPYDAHSGISIVDMGITEDKWEQSIWGLLGFQYGQFNGSGSNVGNLNFQFSNLPSNVSSVTTNALLTSLQSQQYFQNVFSIPLIKPMVGSNVAYYNASVNHGNIDTTGHNASFEIRPSISVQQDSTVIKAADLPRKVLRGYFLIKSDLIDQTGFYQTANPMSIMAIVGKYNSAEDFVNYDGGGPVFTVTRKKTITDIKTQITDPEGELAQVGDNSGVIYRIDKQINTDLKFGENLFAGMYGKVQGQ